MGSVQSNIDSQTQTITNNLLQNANSRCTSTCTNVQNNTNVIITDSTNYGDMKFDQQCSAQATCIMDTNMGTEVSNILDAMAQQQQAADQSMFSLTVQVQTNVSDIQQHTDNNLRQIINAACQASSENIENNTLVYLKNSTNFGELDFSQRGNANAACTIRNMAQMQVSTNASSSVTQGQKVTSVMTMIIALVVIVLIVVLIFLFKPGSTTTTKDKEGNVTTKQGPSVAEQILSNPQVMGAATGGGKAGLAEEALAAGMIV